MLSDKLTRILELGKLALENENYHERKSRLISGKQAKQDQGDRNFQDVYYKKEKEPTKCEAMKARITTEYFNYIWEMNGWQKNLKDY